MGDPFAPCPSEVPHLPASERAAAGRTFRQRVRRRDLGEWTPAPGRDPVAILAEQEATADAGTADSP